MQHSGKVVDLPGKTQNPVVACWAWWLGGVALEDSQFCPQQGDSLEGTEGTWRYGGELGLREGGGAGPEKASSAARPRLHVLQQR